ncbi:MAG: hypothetical protein R2861_05205 [Desulfobacterales bacterium]
MVEFLINFSINPDGCRVTLLHIFRKPTSGEELMGKKFMEEQPVKFQALLEKAKQRLVSEKGFSPDQIDTVLLTEPHPSVTEGIIDFFQKETMILSSPDGRKCPNPKNSLWAISV